MNNKRTVAVTAVVLAALSALLLWLNRGRGLSQAQAVGAAAVESPAQNAPPQSPAAVEKESALRQIADLGNRPIEFYGRVVDQHDNAVPGAAVVLSVRSMKVVSAEVFGDTFTELRTESGADGRFAVTGASGSVLSIGSIKKAGYRAPKVLRSFRYWDNDSTRFRPNPQQPEVFRLWKEAGAEPLIAHTINSALKYDGTPVGYDLAKGRAVTGSGDLIAKVSRSPLQIKQGQKHYEWTLTVEVPNGGLIASDDEYVFLAPESGYQPRLVFRMDPQAKDWTNRKNVRVYLRLADGRYGRAEMRIHAGTIRDEGPFYIYSFLNPSGSRNLECNSEQGLIKPKR